MSVSNLGGITRGRRWVRLICGSERRPDGRARLKCAVLTDSFQYGIDSDRFGLDPFPIREVQPIYFLDPMLVNHLCNQ